MRTEVGSGLARILQNVAAAIIIGGFFLYLWRSRGALASGFEMSWPELIAVGMGVLLTWFVSAAQSFLLYRSEGLRIGLWETCLLTLTGAVANFLPLRLGTLVRMRYVKAVHGLRYTRSVSIAGIRLVLLIVATGILGLVGVLGIYLSRGLFATELALVFAGLLLVSLITAYRPPPVTSRQSILFRTWNDFSKGFAKIRTYPGVAGGVLLLILCQLLLVAGRFYLSLNLMGMEAPSATILAMASATTLVSFVSVVPGGLGLREAVMGYVTLATGLEFNVGLFAGTIDRAVSLVLLLCFGTLSLIYIWGRLRSSALRE